MDPPSRVQNFYHSAMMPTTWICTLSEEEEEEEEAIIPANKRILKNDVILALLSPTKSGTRFHKF